MKKTSQAGFSLIEMLIVVTIMALVAGIALPNLLEMTRGLKYREAARNLASALRSTRAKAVSENREYRLVVDVNGDGLATVGTVSIVVPPFGYAIQRGRLASNSTAYGGNSAEVVNGVTYTYANGWATVEDDIDAPLEDGWSLISDPAPSANLGLRSTLTCASTADTSFQFNPNGTSQAGYVCIMDSSIWQRRFIVGIAQASSGRVSVSR